MTQAQVSAPPQKLIRSNDPRIAHLRTKTNAFTFRWPMQDYTSYVCSELTAETDTVTVYNWDGELDDQCRLEHLLLSWPKTRDLLLIAGHRLGGASTFKELASVVVRTLGTALLPDGTFKGRPRIKIVHGGPLRAPAITAGHEILAQAVRNVKSAIGNKPFIWHENATFTTLAPLLDIDIAGQLQACTCTCDMAAIPSGIVTGTNRRRNEHAWAKVLAYCADNQLVFLSLHSTFVGWPQHVLAELPNFGETMLQPAADPLTAAYHQDIIRQGLAYALWASISAYGAARQLNSQQVDEFARVTISKAGLLPSAVTPRSSDRWVEWSTKPGPTGWTSLTPGHAASTLEAIGTNISCPLSNSIGDLIGAAFDTPIIRQKGLVILKIEGWHRGKALLGGAPYSKKGGHFILAYSNEKATLQAAWSRIQNFRRSGRSPVGRYDPIDAQLKKEWSLFVELIKPILRSIANQADRFPKPQESKGQLVKAIQALENGHMAKKCST